MEFLLAGLHWKKFLIISMIFGSVFQDYLNNLRGVHVLQKLKEANLKIKPKKCFLFQEEVAYLGHIVSQKGVRPDPEKTDQVKL